MQEIILIISIIALTFSLISIFGSLSSKEYFENRNLDSISTYNYMNRMEAEIKCLKNAICEMEYCIPYDISRRIDNLEKTTRTMID